MTSHIKILDEAGNSSISAVHRFRTLAAQGVGIHLFIEGNADRYVYPSAVRQMANGQLVIHELDGYREVIDALSEVDTLPFPKTPKLFFVDRDLSFIHIDRLGADARLYCTPLYSVESFMFQRESVQVSLNELDNLESDSSHIEQCWDLIQRNVTALEHAFLIFTAIVLAAREAGVKVNLNNISVQRLRWFEPDGRISRRARLTSELCRKAGIDPVSINRARVRYFRRRLRQRSVLEWFRGKYVAELVAISIRRYFSFHKPNIGPNRKGKPFKGRVSAYSVDDLIQGCLPRLRTPSCLVGYIETRLAAAA